jgi:iron complex outermembrane receptor protein
MKTFRGAGFRLSIIAAAGSVVLGVAPADRAVAQDKQAGAQRLEEIVVTGSRIVRRDNSSNSPIVTIEADAFQAQMGLNFEAYLNQLPEYNPAASPTTTQGDVQITPINSVGIASISLRGFGPNRNLVLVNGKRTVPINALMVTDVNSIPSALIQRVETITGGASAVYGADAVGGVTNFILRENFEGLEVDSQIGTSDNGDGQETRLSAVFGANLSSGKGNIAIGVEKYSRDGATQGNNKFTRDSYQNPYDPGYFFFLQGTSNLDCQFTCPSQGAVNGIFGTQTGTGPQVFNWGSPNFFRTYTFNYDGTVFVPSSPAGLAKFAGNGPRFTFFPAQQLDGSKPGTTTTEVAGLKWENPAAYVSAPQDRYSLFATGHYDINDKITMYARGTMAESETQTLLFGTNAISGWETQVPYNPTFDSPLLPSLNYDDAAVVAAAIANPTNPAYANPSFRPTGTAGAGHPVPVQVAALLNSRRSFFTGLPAPNAPWLPGWNPDTSLKPRSTVNTNTVWQVETGINFKFGENWGGEFYLSHGQSSAYNNAYGNMSLARFRALVNAPDWGRNANLIGNLGSDGGGTVTRPGFGSGSIHCTGGFYNTFFKGDAPLDDDCFQAINATLQTRAQNFQDIGELNFEGVIAKIKPGEIRAAFGAQKRYNRATFVPDILQSEVSFTDQVIGVYPTGYLDASTEANDIYAEMLIPLLANKKGARRLELELGVRNSKYQFSDDTNTWKALINWQINDWFRMRGGFNRATRAPNLGELFLARQQIFTVGGAFGDPCALRSRAPFGAGGTGADPQLNAGETPPVLAAGQTAAGAQSARLICEALMGAAAATQFYTKADATVPAAGGFAWVDQIGNKNLQSEIADTWTFGFVMNSPFKKPLLAGLSLNVDSYRINVDKAILTYSLDYAGYRCFGTTLVTTPAEAAAQAATPGCQLNPRDPVSGVPLSTTVSYDNQATIKTSGTDIALNWRAQFADFGSKIKGGLGFSVQATFLDYYKTKQSPANYDIETDWKNSLGPSLASLNAGAYKYRTFSTFSYFRDDWSVSLRWRGLPSVWSAGYATQQAIKANNATVAAGGPGILLNYVPTTEVETNAYRLFDLSFTYNIKKISLRGGINNLLNTAPEYTGGTAGVPVGATLTSYCNGAPGCLNPSGYSLPSTGSWNGGYYDTIGRRYFVGFDVKF